MSLRVLSLDHPDWLRTLQGSRADLHYWPAYAAFCCQDEGEQACLFCYEDELGSVFDVKIISSVAFLPFFRASRLQFESHPVDLRSPGFNGPVFRAPPEHRDPLQSRYRQAVNEFCQRRGVVTEFVRFHPLGGPFHWSEQEQAALHSGSDCLYIDLRQGLDRIYQGYSARHRRASRRAERHAVQMHWVPATSERLADFYQLYQQTMERNRAKSVYALSLDYFLALFEALGSSARLMETRTAEQLVSSSIFWLDQGILWYAYSASDQNWLHTHAHSWGLDRVVEWAVENQLQYFVLGGSFEPGDSLDIFKRGFTQTSLAVMQSRMVHNENLLNLLLEAKYRYDQSMGRVTRQDYFPSYRLQ